jgi:hypothetical protein
MPRFTEKQKAAIIAGVHAQLAKREAELCRRQQVQSVRANQGERWKRRQQESVPRHKPPDLDWATLANGQNREFYREVMAEVIYELRREFDHKLKEQAEQMRTVELQLAELRGATSVHAAEYRSAIREMRHELTAEAKVIDLPNALPLRGSRVN